MTVVDATTIRVLVTFLLGIVLLEVIDYFRKKIIRYFNKKENKDMAYNAKETQNEILMVPKGNRGEYIKVSRIIPENTAKAQSIDIRIMYTAVDPNEGEQIRPTQKGVRINSEMLPEIMAAIYANMTEEELADFESTVEKYKPKDEEKDAEEMNEDFEDEDDIIIED